MGYGGRQNPVARTLRFQNEDDSSSGGGEEEAEEEEEEEEDEAPHAAHEQESIAEGTSPSEADISGSDDEQPGLIYIPIQQQQQQQQQQPQQQQRQENEEAAALSEDEESESMIRVVSSSDEEDENARIPHRLLVTLNQYTEPRQAVEAVIMSNDPQPSGNAERPRAGTLHNFYTSRARRSESSFHNLEDGNRLVWNSFDETNPLDRRVNECKFFYS